MAFSFDSTNLLIWGFLSAFVYYIFFYKSRRDKLLSVFKGPKTLPLIGNTLELLSIPNEEFFARLLKWGEEYAPAAVLYLGPARMLLINNPKYVEKLLTSSTHIVKGEDYDFFRPWLGDGLLLSTGQKWSKRRKTLTPAFHFKILGDFVPTFHRESMKLVSILKKKYGDRSSFDLAQYVTKCTTDIICETAMGIELNAQDGGNLEYSTAIKELGEVIQQRAIRPWLRMEFLWRRSEYYKQHEKSLNILHGFTNSVIKQRKQTRAQNKAKVNLNNDDSKAANQDDDMFFGKAKKRNAFLDLLLDVQEEVGVNELSDQDIREETDTFMFAGHDTTSANISFTIFALGAYPETQAKVKEELDSIFGDDKERPITNDDLAKMKYLECVIKESLRIYPSAPIIQRYLTSDLKIDENITIPGDVTISLFIYQLHRNPEIFPDPEVFKPERFSDGSVSKHPFAYVPFSAGPRNCIGQKFAMLEEKVIIANLIRNFEIGNIKDPKDFVFFGELTLRSKDGVPIKLTPRP